ncbi:RING finger protein 122-like [Periophthalmus magnuspinnatus]|uniref:RING finger protein 122-like n=1 Tax=Periophthalmus magnuspinnatus TaxID=409849 RepID=UPI002436A3A6|nr:RING finger protein 122-like [Periophthalmus magnuspinnatus]
MTSSMTFDEFLHLPLNVYIIIIGIGLFVLLPCLVFCCCFIRVRREAARQYVYNKVVLKGAGKKMGLLGQTCAVCLEEFRTKDELGVCPCSHAFHKKVRREAARQYVYNKVVLKGAGKKMGLLGQTCAVCLEEFRTKDELGVCPCSHAFHKKCLLKWLEIRSVCPMCNKPVCRLHPEPPPDPELG